MFKKIESAIEDSPGSRISVNRVLVMDGASNSVGTLRAFASQQKYHYITPLDDNQWNKRKIVNIQMKLSRYIFVLILMISSWYRYAPVPLPPHRGRFRSLNPVMLCNREKMALLPISRRHFLKSTENRNPVFCCWTTMPSLSISG